MYEVLKLYKEGKSFREIEKLTGINRKKASRYVQEEGYEVVKRGTTGSIRKVALDTTKFKNIRSPEQAYWLGFMYADGAISDTTWILEFTQKIRATVETFRGFMKSEAAIIKRRINLNGNMYTAYRLNICSKEVCEDLIALGCTPRKSLTKTFPKLKTTLIIPFIAGYFDGNGTVMLRKGSGSLYGLISTGSEEFAKQLQAITHGAITKNKQSHSHSIYVPVSFMPLLAPYSYKIQNKTCPLQE